MFKPTLRAAVMALSVLFVSIAVAPGERAFAKPTMTPVMAGAADTRTYVTVFVELELAPTITTYHDRLSRPGLGAGDRASATKVAKDHLTRVRAEQDRFRDAVAKSRPSGLVHEIGSLQRTANGLSYVTTRDQIPALRKLPGVRSVSIEPGLRGANTYSVPLIHAPEV